MMVSSFGLRPVKVHVNIKINGGKGRKWKRKRGREGGREEGKEEG